MALVDELHGVEASVCREIVAAVIAVTSLGANSEEVADGGVVGDLFAVNLSSVGKGGLEGLSEDGVELSGGVFTGLTNIEM